MLFGLSQPIRAKFSIGADMEKQEVKFLDYVIVNTGNGDGWVLQKKSYAVKNLWECHLGNFKDLDMAKKYAVLNFMVARPADFSHEIVARMTGSHIYHDGYTFKRVVEKLGIEMPVEIGISNDSNFILTFKGKII
jgi:hypothetical protein